MPVKKLSVSAERVNRLLGRRELRVEVEYEGGNPSRAELLDEISSFLKVPRESTVVVKATPSFGRNVSIVESRVYSSKEAMLSVEPRYILVRNGYLPKEGAREA